MSADKPVKKLLTQQEIRRQKKDASNVKFVTIVNQSDSQTIPIQLRAPAGTDFYVGEQTVPLYPKRMAKFPENRLYNEQIKNFQKTGRIRVLNAN